MLIIFSDGPTLGQLDFSNDKTAKEGNLPPNKKGLDYPFVVIRSKESKRFMSLNSLVNHIMDNFGPDLSTTVMYNVKDDLKEEEERKNKKILHSDLLDGIEDEFIIYCISGPKTYRPTLNASSRARIGFAWIIDTNSR